MPANIPVDLDAFWQKTLARARAQPLDVQVEKENQRLPYQVFRVTYRSLDGIPVRAWLSLPVVSAADGRPPRRWPAIVTAPGYAGWQFGAQLGECQRGYAILQVYPRAQGESGELWQTDGSRGARWVEYGKENPEGSFYQGAFMDVVRGIDFLRTRPDVDTERIGLMGTSQGGLLALGAASVEPGIRAVVAHVPYLCHFRHNAAFAGSELARDAAFLNTWDYFDPAHLAPRIQAPALLSSGGKDSLCPPATIRAVFDNLPGIKALAHYPELVHTSCNDFYAMSWQWMERYLL